MFRKLWSRLFPRWFPIRFTSGSGIYVNPNKNERLSFTLIGGGGAGGSDWSKVKVSGGAGGSGGEE